MRNFPLLCLAILSGACAPLDNGDTFYTARDGTLHTPGSHPHRGRSEHESPGSETADTLLWFSAVRFPDDYDWQRDTAYGNVPCELLLYRDFTPVLTLASGPDACFSPDPDRHHILSGHLYTERMVDGQTRIGRDGVELFRIEDREYLVGLLEEGGDLYTLSRPARGEGFRFRMNGVLLYEDADGIPYGDLLDPSYAPTGALYRDEGDLVFCFHVGGPQQEEPYVVRKGRPAPLETTVRSGLLDVKILDGRACMLRSAFHTRRLSEGRIWREGEDCVITCRVVDQTGDYCGWMLATSPSRMHRLCMEEAYLYYGSGAGFAIRTDGEGNLCWYGPDGTQTAKASRLMSTACATVLDGCLWLGLSALGAREDPKVWTGKEFRPVPLHGYISSLSVEIHPPS